MRLAARGTRDLDDDGATEIRDADLADALRRQARKVHVQAVLLAAAATAVALVLPL